MTFQFQPLSDDEINAQMKRLTPGPGQFQIMACKQGISKSSNNPMLTLELKVWDASGIEANILDFITATPGMQYKLKHLLQSIGLAEYYLTGSLDPDVLVGQFGECVIRIEKTEQYGEQPRIKDYVVSDPAQKKVAAQPASTAPRTAPQAARPPVQRPVGAPGEPPNFNDDIKF